MQFKISISQKAEADLSSLVEYISIELCAPYSAQKIAKSIEQRISQLGLAPESGELTELPKLKGYKIRLAHAGKYRIFYQVDQKSKTVSIIRILHHLQDASKL